MRRLATSRIVGLIIAVAGFGVSIWCARDALRMNAEVHQWIDARPMESAVDLSKPGETSVPFHQTCSTSHGEALFLECDLPDDMKGSLDGLFKDLSASVVIQAADGSAIETVKIDGQNVRLWDDKIMLAGFAPFRKGDYVAALRVDRGAPGLAGNRQVLYAKYQLCGLEEMPVALAGAFALGAGIIGLVAAVCVLPGLLRGGIWREAPQKTA